MELFYVGATALIIGFFFGFIIGRGEGIRWASNRLDEAMGEIMKDFYAIKRKSQMEDKK